jgi:hypothetical protein
LESTTSLLDTERERLDLEEEEPAASAAAAAIEADLREDLLLELTVEEGPLERRGEGAPPRPPALDRLPASTWRE